MTDPNVTYKLAFAKLVETLGRTPTATECLGIHEEYKGSYSRARDARIANERQDARVGGGESARLGGVFAQREATPEPEPLSGPGAINERGEAVSEPEPPSVNCRPSGSLLVTCRRCGQDFTRPATRGRPPVRCESCRG